MLNAVNSAVLCCGCRLVSLSWAGIDRRLDMLAPAKGHVSLAATSNGLAHTPNDDGASLSSGIRINASGEAGSRASEEVTVSLAGSNAVWSGVLGLRLSIWVLEDGVLWTETKKQALA